MNKIVVVLIFMAVSFAAGGYYARLSNPVAASSAGIVPQAQADSSISLVGHSCITDKDGKCFDDVEMLSTPSGNYWCQIHGNYCCGDGDNSQACLKDLRARAQEALAHETAKVSDAAVTSPDKLPKGDSGAP